MSSAETVNAPQPSEALLVFADAVATDLDIIAGLHDREPTRAIVEALQAAPIEEQLGLRLASDPAKAAAAALAIAVSELPHPVTDAALDELAAGFADVYLRYTYRASPEESVWATEEGLVRQAPMFDAREWYRRNNLVVADWANRPDDHLVLELRFLAHLMRAAKDNGGLVEAAKFLDEHLLRWMRKFAVRLVQAGASNWYAALALLTASYLDELRDRLAEATGYARPVEPPPAKRAKKKKLPAPDSVEERPYVPGVAPSW